MPTFTLTSQKTGQDYDVDFERDPTEVDVDEALDSLDQDFYRAQGLDPSIAEQGPVGTASNAFARDIGGTALDAVGGMAKGAAEMKRALGPAGEALRFVPGLSSVMSVGGAGDAVAGFTDAVREAGRDVFPTNPANPVAETIGSGAGQALAMLGTMGAAAPAVGTGAALTVVPSVMGGAMGLGAGIDTAKELGIDNPAGRLAVGAAFGGAEALTERLGGIGGKAAAEALQTGVKAGLKQAGKSVLSEAIEEPISGTLQDAATYTAGQFVADPNRPGYTVAGMKLPELDAEFWKRRKMEAIGGAAGGAVFGGLQLAASGRPAAAPAAMTKPPELPVAEDLGELTAAEVADLEPATGKQDLQVPQRDPILGNVPDGVPTNFQSRPGTTNAEPGSSASLVPAPVADGVGQTVSDAGQDVSDPVQSPSTELPEGAEAPKYSLPVGSQITSNVYGSEGAIQITGEPVWNAEEKAWKYPALTQGGRVFSVAERFIDQVVSQNGQPMSQTRQVVSEPASKTVSVTKGSERAAADQAGEQAIGAGSSPATGASDLATPTLESTLPDARVPATSESPGLAGVQPAGRAGFKNLEPGGKTAGFVNGEILAEAETLIRDGFTDFANWSRAMVTRFGQAIRQYLQGIWDQVKAALPNDAAKNVRLGGAAKAGPVGLAQGGFVAGPGKMKETRSRFASPDEQERLYQVREDITVKAAAEAWVDSMPMAEAVAAMEAGRLPADMTGDVAQHAAGLLIQRTMDAQRTGSEIEQMQARALSHRIAKVWQGWLSQEAGRNLRQRGVVNAELVPYAPVLAAEGVLIDRADETLKKRYEDGGEGATTKLTDLADTAGTEAGGELSKDLEAETGAGVRVNGTRQGAVKQKHPRLKAMLDALRRKLYPGMTWADIFMGLPSAQKSRQREIYRRLMLDERLKSLTQDERLALTNELDKAWQQERRKVFQRELKKAGVLGEKDAGDRAKVEKALPKLIRLINLGMFNSEMFREAIAPEYGLRQITSAEAQKLRTLAEEAYKMPEGLLRNRKLSELLFGIRKATGSSWIEVVTSYWTSAVLSGLRTMWDTFGAASNGLLTNVLQSAGQLMQGRGKAAAQIQAQWWRSLAEGIREAGLIIATGDRSYTKRFGEDLRKALAGERNHGPLPVGEMLWQNGNAFEKWGLAPIMLWTGRLMEAADHINNTATTEGAKAVARAMHPELYARASWSDQERADARAQALREVTGGRAPDTLRERADVARRAREILAQGLRPEDLEAANTVGDMAAFQNDPTGVFGMLYGGMKGGLGWVEQKLIGLSEDATTNKFTRVAAAALGASVYAITGTRFMRFGANFGAEITRYMPGSFALQYGNFYGRNISAQERQLLLGKNLIGLMVLMTLAAKFGLDEGEDDEWHIEGDWSNLSPDEQRQRMSSGVARMTMWRRVNGKVQSVSYKQWPTMGLFAAVGGMADERRYKPQVWQDRGPVGHFLRGSVTGLFQVQNVSAMRNLVEAFGSPTFAADPVTEWVERFTKMGSNYAGGFIPTLIKDAEAWNDPRNFKPEGVMEQLVRSVPILRTTINDGRPQLNLLGEEVKLQRAPWSRTYTSVESGEAHRVLGGLLARGLSLPEPDTSRKMKINGQDVSIKELGREAEWKYQRAVGQAYKAWLATEGQALLAMPDVQLQRVIEHRAKVFKIQAANSLRVR